MRLMSGPIGNVSSPTVASPSPSRTTITSSYSCQCAATTSPGWCSMRQTDCCVPPTSALATFRIERCPDCESTHGRSSWLTTGMVSPPFFAVPGRSSQVICCVWAAANTQQYIHDRILVRRAHLLHEPFLLEGVDE